MQERLVRLMPAARLVLPAGDFRDWDAIEAWAHEIAAELVAKVPVEA
jgi:menaquinone-dependent protoporphyrinogen oxidase